MIQRKQSLWLFLAALLNAGVFYFDLYRYHTAVQKPLLDKTVAVDTVVSLRVGDHFPSLLIALVMTLLPVVTIFMYKQRGRQIAMSFVSMLAISSFMGLLLKRVNDLSSMTPAPTNANYWIGAILPIIAFVLLILAMIGIRKDEKLVKSVDRLR